MPTSSAGNPSSRRDPLRHSQRGVTLIEMMVVVAVVGLIAGVSFPAVSTGLDSVRLATAGDSIASFLNSAVNRTERLQQPMEVIITPKEGKLSLYSNAPGFVRELQLPDGIALEKVMPPVPEEPEDSPRRLILIPGSTVPAIGIQFANRHGGRRIVWLDPMTGFPRIESVEMK